MKEKLLTRDEFRNRCLERDGHKCVICKEPGKDVHHIIERRLFYEPFESGGYFLSNGSTLCETHHIEAEQTVLSCEKIREACNIKDVVLPSHLYTGERYDKWGNCYLTNGNRTKGELFDDISVQKILPEFIKSQFSSYIKYPRTLHLPFSPGISDDDRVLHSTECLKNKDVVVTLKMDGENTSSYNGYIHARSIDSDNDLSRNWVKNYLYNKLWELPQGWRVCGENMYAKHSISYDNLETYFFMFSIWDDKNICLDWNETQYWADLLELKLVPVLYQGVYDEEKIKGLFTSTYNECEMEGYVVRLKESFHYSKFRNSCFKYVRAGHVQTNEHWKRTWIPNSLKK